MLRILMDTLARYHFWFALMCVAGLMACLVSKAIDASAGLSMIGLIAGHYLGKTQINRSGAALPRGSRGDL